MNNRLDFCEKVALVHIEFSDSLLIYTDCCGVQHGVAANVHDLANVIFVDFLEARQVYGTNRRILANKKGDNDPFVLRWADVKFSHREKVLSQKRTSNPVAAWRLQLAHPREAERLPVRLRTRFAHCQKP